MFHFVYLNNLKSTFFLTSVCFAQTSVWTRILPNISMNSHTAKHQYELAYCQTSVWTRILPNVSMNSHTAKHQYELTYCQTSVWTHILPNVSMNSHTAKHQYELTYCQTSVWTHILPNVHCFGRTIYIYSCCFLLLYSYLISWCSSSCLWWWFLFYFIILLSSFSWLDKCICLLIYSFSCLIICLEVDPLVVVVAVAAAAAAVVVIVVVAAVLVVVYLFFVFIFFSVVHPLSNTSCDFVVVDHFVSLCCCIFQVFHSVSCWMTDLLTNTFIHARKPRWIRLFIR